MKLEKSEDLKSFIMIIIPDNIFEILYFNLLLCHKNFMYFNFKNAMYFYM